MREFASLRRMNLCARNQRCPELLGRIIVEFFDLFRQKELVPVTILVGSTAQHPGIVKSSVTAGAGGTTTGS